MSISIYRFIAILVIMLALPHAGCVPSPPYSHRYFYDIDMDLAKHPTDLRHREPRRTGRGNSVDSWACDNITAVPDGIRSEFPLNVFYQRYTHAYGIPIVSSNRSQDAALTRACYVVRFLLADRQDIRDAMYDQYGRVAVIAQTEQTTDIPEHSYLGSGWNTRARGLGGTSRVPVTSNAEENLLCRSYLHDRWYEEDVLVHEFAHAIHLVSLNQINASFEPALQSIYSMAKADNLWSNTYAISNFREYFAEGVQGFFNVQTCKSFVDNVHNHICTREALQTYDSRLYNLIVEVFPCMNPIVDRCESNQGLASTQGLRMNCDVLETTTEASQATSTSVTLETDANATTQTVTDYVTDAVTYSASGNITGTATESPVIAGISVSALASDQLNVTWDVTFDGNLPPPSCSVEYRTLSGGWVPSQDSPIIGEMHTVMNLDPYTYYYVRVQCENKVGPSNSLIAGPVRTHRSNPSEPRNLRAMDIQSNSFFVTWETPSTENGPIDRYRVTLTSDSDINQEKEVPGNTLESDFDGLKPYTNYIVVVTAFNREFGIDLEGLPSDELAVKTDQDVPSRPLNVRAEQEDVSCHISWDPPEHENGIIQSYTVFYIAYPRPETGLSAVADASNSGSVIVEAANRSFSFNKSDLAAFSDFGFLVSARTEAPGMSNNSTEAVGICITNAAGPALLNPSVEPDNVGNSVTESTFQIRLAPVNQRNGPISCFEITIVQLENDDKINDKDPDVLYHPDKLGTHAQAQEAVGIPYVALVLSGHELNQSKDVEIGSGGESVCGSAGRKRRQTPRDHSGENGALTPDTKYTAFIRAYVQVEDGTEAYTSSPLMQPIWTSQAGPGSILPIMIAFVSVAIAVLLIVVVFCAVKWRIKRRSKNIRTTRTTVEMVNYKVTLEQEGVTSTVYEDVGLPTWALRWEILWEDLVVDDRVLGRGNFGEVKSGAVNIGGKMTKAAIKILKGCASQTDREEFMEEFRTMTNIGYHPNVVSLLGACQHKDVLYVALEYLPHGDLRSYLRKVRLQSDSDEGALSSCRLVKFALDVAKGMKHLAMSGVIHRDLAARNILLGDGLTAKVSDFGLSRGEDIYVKTSTRRVPARWLAIESLMHQAYTTQSDVWSFGILLWEIASMAGTPYPDITTKALPERLMEGYRMTKPKNCDDEIYALMLQCWQEEPQKRPTFSDLVTTLTKMDDNREEHIYMAIDRTGYENFSVIRPELDDN